MAQANVSELMSEELAAKMSAAGKAAELLREAAARLDTPSPGESRVEAAARVRGAAVLANTGALELAGAAGWIEALAEVELHEAT